MMTGPPKRERLASDSEPSQIKHLRRLYDLVRIAQAPVESLFWLLEERLGRLRDKIDNLEAGQ